MAGIKFVNVALGNNSLVHTALAAVVTRLSSADLTDVSVAT